ncbi:1,4-dihydroxy-2-naphthoate octaprenyltransferase [Bifidobacterium moukalabense]|uniref:1,4-dihydroxy-2-naphthoate octaprenyltransferase n=1 Tax=Bifidobacterium moukalabense TaxID=1333651 RepID=UPI0010F95742|nr:1,4-dihydroxy-2-naphthoate octaprenyltransferase [Bifidobacterium moukalabense]
MAGMTMSTWIRGARLKTLPLAVAPVIIGTALSWKGVFVYSQGGDVLHEPCPFFGGQRDLGETKLGSLVGACHHSVSWFILVAVLCGCVALFLQIAANFANDYSDGVRGTDEGRGADMEPGRSSAGTLSTRDPSRGPARLVASGVNPGTVLAAAGISALIACLCGLAVCALTGYWWFILVGFACLVAGWCYVGGKHPYGYHYLGEVFVFVFFGLVATCGTMFALTGTVSLSGIWGGCAAGFVAMAVLCVNNLRDIESDRNHGKHTWMTALGRSKGAVLAIALLTMAPAMAILFFLVLCRSVLVAEGVPAMSIVSIAAILIMCAIHAAAIVAIAKERYGTALPLCSLGSLVLAVTFVMSSMLM